MICAVKTAKEFFLSLKCAIALEVEMALLGLCSLSFSAYIIVL